MNINTKKTIAACLMALLSAPWMAQADDAPGFSYTQVESKDIDQASVAAGATFDVLDHHLIASLSANQLTRPGTVEFMKLDIPADSMLAAQEGYKAVAPVVEYKLRNTQLKKGQEIKLTIPFESDLQFDKFAFYWSWKKQSWREVESVTDLAAKTVTLTMSLNNTRILIADTDAMVFGHSSWYRFKGCMCAASPDYPKGTQLLVTNMDKNESILIKVNDWGPERDLFPNRVIDLDLVAFKKLAKKSVGVLTNIRVVPFHAEGYGADIVSELKKGKAVKIDEALVAPYIPKNAVATTSL